jgi:hypothetical protein
MLKVFQCMLQTGEKSSLSSILSALVVQDAPSGDKEGKVEEVHEVEDQEEKKNVLAEIEDWGVENTTLEQVSVHKTYLLRPI